MLKHHESPIALREGEIRDNLDLRCAMQPEGWIEVVGGDATTGKPIANYTARVSRIISPMECQPSHGRLKASGMVPGYFFVEGMTPGRPQIELAAPGYVAQRIACEVLSGRTTELS